MLHNNNFEAQVRYLCTLADAAERLNLPESRIRRWSERRASIGFPTPIYQHKSTTIYYLPEIERWIKLWYATRRSPDER